MVLRRLEKSLMPKLGKKPASTLKGTSYATGIITRLSQYVLALSVQPQFFVVEPLHEVQTVNRSCGQYRFEGIVRVLGDIEDGLQVEASTRIVHGSIGKAKIRLVAICK